MCRPFHIVLLCKWLSEWLGPTFPSTSNCSVCSCPRVWGAGHPCRWLSVRRWGPEEYGGWPFCPGGVLHTAFCYSRCHSHRMQLTMSPGVVQWGSRGVQTYFSEGLTGLRSSFGLWTRRISLWWQLSGTTQQEVQLSACGGELVE